jgi:ankyrin repeat protein
MAHTPSYEELSTLFFAAGEGDVDTLRTILAAGVPVDTELFDGATALRSAVEKGQVLAAEVLLQAGANPNYIVAPRSVKHLAPGDAASKSPARSALNVAVSTANPGMINLLLDHGANPRIVDAGMNTAAHRMLDVAGQFLPKQDGEMILTELLKRMLDAGIRPDHLNQAQQSLLHIAIEKNAPVSVLEALLDRGVSAELYDSSGRRALHMAALCDREDVLRVLIARGADLEAANSIGSTPLAFSRSAAVAQALVEAGANVDSQNYNGESVLSKFLGQMRGESISAIVVTLLEAGADLDTPSFEGKGSAREIIEGNNLSGVTAFLAARRARQTMRTAGGSAPLHRPAITG